MEQGRAVPVLGARGLSGTWVYDEGLGYTVPCPHGGQRTVQGQAEPSLVSSASASHHSQASKKKA